MGGAVMRRRYGGTSLGTRRGGGFQGLEKEDPLCHPHPHHNATCRHAADLGSAGGTGDGGGDVTRCKRVGEADGVSNDGAHGDGAWGQEGLRGTVWRREHTVDRGGNPIRAREDWSRG